MPTYSQGPVNWQVHCRATLFRKERNLNELVLPKIAARTVELRPRRILPTYPKPVGKRARFHLRDLRLRDLEHWLRTRVRDRGEALLSPPAAFARVTTAKTPPHPPANESQSTVTLATSWPVSQSIQPINSARCSCAGSIFHSSKPSSSS